MSASFLFELAANWGVSDNGRTTSFKQWTQLDTFNAQAENDGRNDGKSEDVSKAPAQSVGFSAQGLRSVREVFEFVSNVGASQSILPRPQSKIHLAAGSKSGQHGPSTPDDGTTMDADADAEAAAEAEDLEQHLQFQRDSQEQLGMQLYNPLSAIPRHRAARRFCMLRIGDIFYTQDTIAFSFKDAGEAGGQGPNGTRASLLDWIQLLRMEERFLQIP